MARWGWQKRELNERGESRSQAFWEKPNIELARPTGIEPVLRVPETPPGSMEILKLFAFIGV